MEMPETFGRMKFEGRWLQCRRKDRSHLQQFPHWNPLSSADSWSCKLIDPFLPLPLKVLTSLTYTHYWINGLCWPHSKWDVRNFLVLSLWDPMKYLLSCKPAFCPFSFVLRQTLLQTSWIFSISPLPRKQQHQMSMFGKEKLSLIWRATRRTFLLGTSVKVLVFHMAVHCCSHSQG